MDAKDESEESKSEVDRDSVTKELRGEESEGSSKVSVVTIESSAEDNVLRAAVSPHEQLDEASESVQDDDNQQEGVEGVLEKVDEESKSFSFYCDECDKGCEDACYCELCKMTYCWPCDKEYHDLVDSTEHVRVGKGKRSNIYNAMRPSTFAATQPMGSPKARAEAASHPAQRSSPTKSPQKWRGEKTLEDGEEEEAGGDSESDSSDTLVSFDSAALPGRRRRSGAGGREECQGGAEDALAGLEARHQVLMLKAIERERIIEEDRQNMLSRVQGSEAARLEVIFSTERYYADKRLNKMMREHASQVVRFMDGD